jgi:glutathione synthase/RimK-type ligase-like ATP-grasp enzyme
MPDLESLQYSEPIAKATHDMLEKASVQALKKLKYDFGGLDFGMDKFGNLKIFEVNSRMGLLEQTLYTYKRVFTALRTLDINRYKRERWS